MSFTFEQAWQLRDRLPAMDFRTPVSDDPLTRAYLSHYRLDAVRSLGPLRHCLGRFPSQHYRLACQYFGIPAAQCKGTIAIVHGYYDHVGLFRHPIEFCLTRGYSVLIFDLPGHGLSEGDPASIASFDQYSQALVDCIEVAAQAGVAGPWQVLAQSTGAATVINCLLYPERFPLPTLQKIILLAPLLRPVAWRSGLLKYWLLHWFIKRVDREFGLSSHDESFLRFVAEHDPLQARHLTVDWVRSLNGYLQGFARADPTLEPVHIIQGTRDTTVDWRYNLPRLSAKFPAAETHLIEGARHHLVNESEHYRQELFRLVAAILDA